MTRLAAYLLAAVLASGPALADGRSDSYRPLFVKHVRDTDRGLRATIRYFTEVMIGGMETWIDENGEEQVLYWDGITGVFEAEITEGGPLDETEAKAFLIEAIPVVCPSADWSEIARRGEIYQIGRFVEAWGQCPAADEKAHK